MRLRAGVVSDCGHVRSANEDSFILRPGLYAVCDGMGGARAGEVASQMACLGLLAVDPTTAGLDELRQAIVTANMAIIQRSTSESALLGMGTTLTAALLKDDGLVVAHVGDSRAYLLHEDTLTQITADHSWVGEMVRRGELTLAQAARHPHRSVITRALGTDADLEPDMIESPVVPGDRVLLCSDGLTGMVDDETLGHLMSLGADAQTTAQSLVDAALENGGEDNVTVVVIDIQASGEKSAGDEPGYRSDPRILLGPSNREASADSSSRGVERLSMAARERMRRRGPALARPGARRLPGLRMGPEAAEDGEGSQGKVEPEDDHKPAQTTEPAAAKADEGAKDTVPPPTKRRGNKSAGGAKKGRRRRWLVAVVVVLLLVVLAVGGFAWYNSTVYYLGVDHGKVALFRGLPWEVLGIEFSSVDRTGTVDYTALGLYDRARVDSHDLVSKDKGDQFLDGLSTEL